MQKYITLLRGINVSSKNKIKMVELRDALASTKLSNINTYIQSGNILFEYKKTSVDKLNTIIHDTILKSFGLDVPCLTILLEDLIAIQKENPYQSEDIKQLCVSFLSTPIDQALLAKIDIDSKKDTYIAHKNHIYLHLPGGAGKTKLTNNFFERKLKQTITTRNWKTVCKLIDLHNDS